VTILENCLVNRPECEIGLSVKIINNNCPTEHCEEEVWGDLECLYKACQAAITNGGLFTDIGINE